MQSSKATTSLCYFGEEGDKRDMFPNIGLNIVKQNCKSYLLCNGKMWVWKKVIIIIILVTTVWNSVRCNDGNVEVEHNNEGDIKTAHKVT